MFTDPIQQPPMPQWLQNQLSRAFLRKDKRNLRMLNDCWFFYAVPARSNDSDDEKMADHALDPHSGEQMLTIHINSSVSSSD